MMVVEIRLHPEAPPKPRRGETCNRCGACCAAEPCPLSRALLGHRTGACPALTWSSDEACYGCGLLLSPAQYLHWLPDGFTPLARRLVRRWIAAGSGCDFDAEMVL